MTNASREDWFMVGLLVPVVVAVVAASVAAPGTLVPGSATTRSSITAPITLNVPNPQHIYEDTNTSVSGRLNTGRSGKVLILQRRQPDRTWTTWARTTTGDSGRFRLTVRPANPGSVVIRMLHQTADGPQLSIERVVYVQNRAVSIAMDRSHFSAFDNIVVHGDVISAARTHRLLIQRLIDGTWSSIASVWTGEQGHHFYKSLPNNLPGRWTIRAVWPGQHPDEGSREISNSRTYDVSVSLDPVVTAVTRAQLGHSYHTGCPVGPAHLRNVAVNFYTFDRRHVARGTLVVRDSAVGLVKDVWGRALAVRYPYREIYPTAHYGGSDASSMWHDNTSAFNCRTVTGDPTSLSPHSYGTAFDLNPVENPYMDVHGTWWPKDKGIQYRNRSVPRPGMLYRTSSVTQVFLGHGFRWGGVWVHPDYQHFDPASAVAASRARPFDEQAVPSPRILGPGWRGSRTVVRARDADSAAHGVLPLGCAVRPEVRLASPVHAWQATYRSAGPRPAQVVVLAFESFREARSYFAGLATILRACTEPDGPTGVSVTMAGSDSTSMVGTRTYGGVATWSEVDVRVGARVAVLLAPDPVAGPDRVARDLGAAVRAR